MKLSKTSIKFFDWFEKYDLGAKSKASDKPTVKVETNMPNLKINTQNKHSSEVVKKSSDCSCLNKKISIY